MAEARQITLNGERVQVERFRGYKFIVAGHLVRDIGDGTEAILAHVAEKAEQYKETHKVTITRELADERGWDDLLQGPLKERSHIELPQPATPDQRIMFGFSKGLEVAEDQVIKLVGLVLIKNNDLRAAKRADRVPEALQEIGEAAVFDGEIGELIDLAGAVAETIGEQLAERAEALGKLRGLYDRLTGRNKKTTSTDPEVDEHGRRLTPEVGSIVQTEKPSTGSTSSQVSTDGEATESSSEKTGEPSLATQSA